MRIHWICGGASAALTALWYLLCPTLSLWWLVPLLIGGYAAIWLLLILSIVLFSFGMNLAAPTQLRHTFYGIISHIAEWVCSICGKRIVMKGMDRLPTDTPFLFVGNHRSNLDPIVALAALRGFDTTFVSKPENFNIPVIGLVLRNLGFLAIDRNSARNAVATIKTAIGHITERAMCVGIYPEGTRNKTDDLLLPFHNGSFKIATSARCPVAVTTIRYDRGTVIFRVVDVLEADYIAAHRTDAISERARTLIEQDLLQH